MTPGRHREGTEGRGKREEGRKITSSPYHLITLSLLSSVGFVALLCAIAALGELRGKVMADPIPDGVSLSAIGLTFAAGVPLLLFLTALPNRIFLQMAASRADAADAPDSAPPYKRRRRWRWALGIASSLFLIAWMSRAVWEPPVACALPDSALRFMADRLPDDEPVLFQAAMRERDAGRLEEAEQRLSAAILAARSARAYAVRALIRADRGDYQSAGDDFREATAIDAGNAYSRMVEARYLYATVGPVQAEARVRELLKEHSSMPDGWYLLGLCRYDVGDTAGAVTDLQRAIQYAPRRAVLYRELAQVQHSVGDLPAAEQSSRDALKYDPTDTLAMVLLAETLLDRAATEDNLAEAERWLQKASAESPKWMTEMRIARGLGRLAVLRGQWKEAINHLEPACYDGADDSAAWYYLARAYKGAHDHRFAQTIAKFERIEQFRRQEKSLRGAVKEQEDLFEARQRLAEFYVLNGKRDAASSVLSDFLQRHPADLRIPRLSKTLGLPLSAPDTPR